MGLDKELLNRVRQLDEFDLRRLTIFVRGLLVARSGREEDAGAPPPPPVRGAVTYRQERVRCGKQGCTTCPHGPYWYAYWREDGRLRSRYIGKTRPPDDRPPWGPSAAPEPPTGG